MRSAIISVLKQIRPLNIEFESAFSAPVALQMLNDTMWPSLQISRPSQSLNKEKTKHDHPHARVLSRDGPACRVGTELNPAPKRFPSAPSQQQDRTFSAAKSFPRGAPKQAGIFTNFGTATSEFAKLCPLYGGDRRLSKFCNIRIACWAGGPSRNLLSQADRS